MRRSSGVGLCPLQAKEGMLVAPEFSLKDLQYILKIWSMCACGQIAMSTGFYHSKKCLTGGFSSLEISFLFLLSIALSSELLLNGQSRRTDANIF